MARTVYKGTTSYKDPNTGSIYVDRQGTSSQTTQKNNTPSAAQTKGMPGGNSTLGVMGSQDIYPGSLHGQTAESQRQVTYNGGDAPGPTWTGQQSTFYSKSRPEREAFSRSPFSTSDDTDEYYDLMKQTEGDRPGPFESRYEGAIQSILDGILNRKSFDAKTDPNYSLLYDQMRESYMNAGNKAMRDAMGAMQAQTGGYGSTAAQIAGSQANDNYLQGMNDQNTALMQLAYQMYGDEMADRYNQLGAVTGLDNTDYGRYRDTVGDWMADRDYYARMYDTMYGHDWDKYQFDTNMDWNQYALDTQMDWDEYQYDNNLEYQKSRDALSDYDSAFNKAMALAQAGQAIPQRYAGFLEPDTLAALNGIAAQMQAGAVSGGGSSGGSGRGGSRSGSSTKKSAADVDLVDVMNRARNTGATKQELNDIYNDMTKEQKTRYNLQLRH